MDHTRGCAPLTVNLNFIPNPPVPPNRSDYSCLCDAGCACNAEYTGDFLFNDGQNRRSFTFDDPREFYFLMKFQGQNPDLDSIAIDVRPDTPPAFEVYSCGNSEAVIEIVDNSYDAYEIDYGDGTAPIIVRAGDPVLPHTFSTPNPQTVGVRGLLDNALDNCTPLSKSATVITTPTLPVAEIRNLTVLNPQSIAVDYVSTPNVLYQLEMARNGTAAFQFVGILGADDTRDTVRNLDTENNFYCFRVKSANLCDDNRSVFSDTICSVNLGLDIGDLQHQLAWETLPDGIQNFQIRRGAEGNFANTTALNFLDEGLRCGEEYCYTVNAVYTNGATSISQTQCGVAQSEQIPPPINNVSASVAGNQVLLEWEQPAGFFTDTYNLSRTAGEAPFSSIGQATEQTYTDRGLSTHAVSYCYQIEYLDECGNTPEDEAIACTILLKGEEAGSNTVALDWNFYEGWQNGVSQYEIDWMLDDNDVATTVGVGLLDRFLIPNLSPTQQVINFIVRAIPNDPTLTEVRSNEFAFIRQPNLYFPTAFTPNGDGSNDEFRIFGRFIDGYDLKIFSRWGEMIFFSDNPEVGWDGVFAGKEMPQGAYGYRVKVVDQNGRTYTRTGSFMLMRP